MEIWQWIICAIFVEHTLFNCYGFYMQRKYRKEREQERKNAIELDSLFKQIEACFISHTKYSESANSNFIWLSKEIAKLKAKHNESGEM